EAQMAVADLDETEPRRRRLGGANQTGPRNATCYGPDRGGTRPGHAFQEAAAVIAAGLLDHGSCSSPGSAIRTLPAAIPARLAWYSAFYFLSGGNKPAQFPVQTPDASRMGLPSWRETIADDALKRSHSRIWMPLTTSRAG